MKEAMAQGRQRFRGTEKRVFFMVFSFKRCNGALGRDFFRRFFIFFRRFFCKNKQYGAKNLATVDELKSCKNLPPLACKVRGFVAFTTPAVTSRMLVSGCKLYDFVGCLHHTNTHTIETKGVNYMILWGVYNLIGLITLTALV